MNELYWITRLDNVWGIYIFFMIALGVILFYQCFFLYEDDIEEKEKKYRKKYIKIVMIFIFIVSLFMVFTPNTKEAYLIYGVGGTIDYIQQNDKAQKIPDKCIEALDKYLEDINKKEK